MEDEALKVIVVLAGSNGAGKSTFHRAFLAGLGMPFINADEIAFRLFGRHALTREEGYQAAERAETERHELMAAGRSFIFETVLSDPHGSKVAFLAAARRAGYFVEAVFIGIDSPDISIARVQARVELGGHDVPDEKLESRFERTLENLRRLIDAVDRLTLYDNNSVDRPFQLVAVFEHGRLMRRIAMPPGWALRLDFPSRDLPETVIEPPQDP